MAWSMSCTYRSPFLSWAVISIFTILCCGHWCGLTSQPSPACRKWFLIYRYCVGFLSLSVPLGSKALPLISFSEVSLLPGVSGNSLPLCPLLPTSQNLLCFTLSNAELTHLQGLAACELPWKCLLQGVSSESQVELQKSVHPKKCWHCSMNSSVKPEWETGLSNIPASVLPAE